MVLKKVFVLYLSLLSTFSWASEFQVQIDPSSISNLKQEILIEEKVDEKVDLPLLSLTTYHEKYTEEVNLLETQDKYIKIDIKNLDSGKWLSFLKVMESLNIPFEKPSFLGKFDSYTECILKKVQTPKRVLCLDGGGTRGIIEAVILDYIEKTTGKQIYKLFDVVACTSTGAIVGAGLCFDRPVQKEKNLSNDEKSELTGPYTAAEIIQLYKEIAKEIFSKYYYSSFYGVNGTQYDDKPAIEAYEKYFGNTPLSKAKTSFIATSQNLSDYKPHIFTSEDAKKNIGNENIDLPLDKVVRAATGAPSYFDPVVINDITFGDGGITNNNPSEIGILEACKQLKVNPHELLVLSLGTGFSELKRKSYTNLSGIQWLDEISRNIFNGKSQDFTIPQWLQTCRENDILGKGSLENYLRIQPDLPEDLYRLSDNTPKFFEELIKIAQDQIEKHQTELNKFIKNLIVE